MGRAFFIKTLRLSKIWIVKCIIGCIFIYQYAISPFLPYRCYFKISCSEYTKLAINRYGLFRGVWLGIKRILRCQPFFLA